MQRDRLVVRTGGGLSSLLALHLALSLGACAHEGPRGPGESADRKGPEAGLRDDGPFPRARRIEMVFDRRTGVYLIVRHPGHYFDGDRFYRRLGERWQAAPEIQGPWQHVEPGSLPQGLRPSAPGGAPVRPADRPREGA